MHEIVNNRQASEICRVLLAGLCHLMLLSHLIKLNELLLIATSI